MPRARREPAEDPETSQPPAEDGSQGSSTASSASDFLADPGPEFDPHEAGQDAKARDGDRLLSVAPGGEAAMQVEWEPAVIEAVLTAQGSALHSLAGKTEEDWVYTKTELRAISAPLARIFNRYDAMRAAAGTGDEISVILGFSGYTIRSVQERKAVIALEKQALEAAEAREAQYGPQPPIPRPEETQ